MTATPTPHRPMLIPGLPRVWRGRDTLQLGLDQRRAVILEPAAGGTGELLDLVDGTRSEATVLRHARRLGLTDEQALALLDALRRAGLLLGAHHFLPARLPEEARDRLAGEAASIALGDSGAVDNPAQVLRRRYAAEVVLTGPGPAAGPIAIALAQAGVGRIHAALSGPVLRSDRAGGALTGDEERRAGAVAAAVRRVAPDVRTGPVARGRASLVIQLGLDRPAPVLAAGFAQRRQAHLLVGARDGTMVVGPLVPASGVPCLRCLDLHRRDRDPAWPVLAAQLLPRAGGAEGPAGGAATVLAAAAVVAEQALAHLDGGAPETIGAAVEIDGPSRVRRRRWGQHPECDCGRRHRRSPRFRPGTFPDPQAQ